MRYAVRVTVTWEGIAVEAQDADEATRIVENFVWMHPVAGSSAPADTSGIDLADLRISVEAPV